MHHYYHRCCHTYRGLVVFFPWIWHSISVCCRSTYAKNIEFSYAWNSHQAAIKIHHQPAQCSIVFMHIDFFFRSFVLHVFVVITAAASTTALVVVVVIIVVVSVVTLPLLLSISFPFLTLFFLHTIYVLLFTNTKKC